MSTESNDIEARKGRLKTALLKIKNNLDLLIQRKRNDIYNKEKEFLDLMSNPNICYETRKTKITMMLMEIYKKNAMMELSNLVNEVYGHENLFAENNPTINSYQGQLSGHMYSLLYANNFFDIPGIRELRDELFKNGVIQPNEDFYNNSMIHPNIKFYLKEKFPTDNEIEDYLGFLFHKFHHILPKNVVEAVENANINKVYSTPNPQTNTSIPQNYMNPIQTHNPVQTNTINQVEKNSITQGNSMNVKQSYSIAESKIISNSDSVIKEGNPINQNSEKGKNQTPPIYPEPNLPNTIRKESESSSKNQLKDKTFKDLTINSKVYLLSKITQNYGLNKFKSQSPSENAEFEATNENKSSKEKSPINSLSSEDFEPGFSKKSNIYESIDLLNIREEEDNTEIIESNIRPCIENELLIPYVDLLELSKNISFKNETKDIDLTKIKKIYENEHVELFLYKKNK